MYCSSASQQLQLYLDHRLTFEQMRKLEAHLGQCATCQAELFLLEEVVHTVGDLQMVAEPADLTVHIMQRVARSPQHKNEDPFLLLRLSLPELITAMLLATFTTLGVMMGQPSLRSILPFANGHDGLSLAFSNTLHLIGMFDSGVLYLAFWVIGTILGLFITLAVAGDEMRSVWIKAVIDRLPVWQ